MDMTVSNNDLQDPSDVAEFRVLFQGIKIFDVTKHAIEKAIRAVVMQEIASLDYSGEIKISATVGEETRRLGHTVLGYVASGDG
jgi:hypothetical protein